MKKSTLMVTAVLASGTLLGSNFAAADDVCGLGLMVNDNEAYKVFFTNTEEDETLQVTALCGPVGSPATTPTSYSPVSVSPRETEVLSDDLSECPTDGNGNLGLILVETGGGDDPEGAISVHITNADGTSIGYTAVNCDN